MVVVQSVTNEEIARYWRQRHILEQDHLFAAVKAAARLRARNLSESCHLQFEESLTENDERSESAGVKDWWTTSKYAYLNQPRI